MISLRNLKVNTKLIIFVSQSYGIVEQQ